MNEKLPIVVIGQNYCTSLGLVKALGEAGYRVEIGRRVVGHPRFSTPEMKSKYVDKAVVLHTGSDRDMIDAVIKNFAVPYDKKVLIPSDDFFVALIDRHLDEFARFFVVPNVRNEQGAVERLMDKSRQNEIARKCGIKVVESVIIKIVSSKEPVIPENTPFPCFIKPLTSVGYPKSYSQKCETRKELLSVASQIAQERECTLLAEQFVEIEKEYTIPGIAVGTEVIIPAVLEKFNTGEGEHKGVTVIGRVHKSNVIGNLTNKLKTLMHEFGFQGIFDIEILQSKGELFFNEVNLRNGAAGYSLTKSGVNLPAMYADYLVKSVKPKLSLSFKDGCTFVNEKAALEYYLGGYGTFRTFVKTIANADIKFVLSTNDMKAYFSFCLLFLRSMIKKAFCFSKYESRKGNFR